MNSATFVPQQSEAWECWHMECAYGCGIFSLARTAVPHTPTMWVLFQESVARILQMKGIIAEQQCTLQLVFASVTCACIMGRAVCFLLQVLFFAVALVSGDRKAAFFISSICAYRDESLRSWACQAFGLAGCCQRKNYCRSSVVTTVSHVQEKPVLKAA